MGLARCDWGFSSPLSESYHDTEWGVPLHDDVRLFEFLVLNGAQAGLSWSTILNRRDGYRVAYEGFDPAVVAAYGDADAERLHRDARIIRNRAKIASSINNAKAFVSVQEEFGSFNAYIWAFVGGVSIQNHWTSWDEIPPQTSLSIEISGDLKSHGFSFVGPTIVYAHMQATGMVNDHCVGCHRHAELSGR